MKKGQINTLMSFFLTIVSLSSSFYLTINFFVTSMITALVLSTLTCLWSSLLTSFKSGYFFGLKLDKKVFSKAIIYSLVLTFFILYQIFMGWENIVFAATPTTTATSTSTTTTLPKKFETWTTASGTFTIAEPRITNIYVKNMKKTEKNNYNVSYKKEVYDANMNRVDHLIYVHMPSNKIISVEPNRVGSTSSAIIALGPFTRGKVTFNVTSEFNPSEYDEVVIEIKPGYGLNLPEFDSIHLIQLLLLASLLLVISYKPLSCF